MTNPLKVALEEQLRLAHAEIQRLQMAGDRLARVVQQITGEGQWPADREIDEALKSWRSQP